MQIAAVFTALAFACNSVLSVPQDAAAPAVAPLAQPAATDQTAVIEGDVFARRVLATANLVLKRHVDPPTRQAMIAAALKALLKAAGQPPTAAIRTQKGG